ncbi:MAG: NDP-sugar synthase [Patescibacteria group bacterium]|nr:NDP-sugar synthase [Patescibacteria group bacterium]
MKAMILAAGEGTRLRPLTTDKPKPILPIVNRPLLEYTIQLLKRHGITNLVINLYHKPEEIMNVIGKGSNSDVNIVYSKETVLLGTAGGVKKVESEFTDAFIVIYGDNLIDVDLDDLIDFHYRTKGLATIGLFHAENPSACGIVARDESGRVIKFVEKPAPSEVFTDTANAGIFVFEPEILNYIPNNSFSDFGKDIFPILLNFKIPVFAKPVNGYLQDTGTIPFYKKAHIDALEKKINLLEFVGKEVYPCIWIGDNFNMENDVKLVPPVVIGKNAVISSNAVIGPNVVTGDNVTIGQKARIFDSVLWDNIKIGSKVVLDGCVIADNASIGEGTEVSPDAVIGGRVILKPYSVIENSTKIYAE